MLKKIMLMLALVITGANASLADFEKADLIFHVQSYHYDRDLVKRYDIEETNFSIGVEQSSDTGYGYQAMLIKNSLGQPSLFLLGNKSWLLSSSDKANFNINAKFKLGVAIGGYTDDDFREKNINPDDIEGFENSSLNLLGWPSIEARFSGFSTELAVTGVSTFLMFKYSLN